MFNHNLILNEALETSYKISTGKRAKFKAQTYLEVINDSKIVANKRIKMNQKVVNSLYTDEGYLVKDPTTLKA